MKMIDKKIESDASAIVLKCHPFLWWLNFGLGFSLSLFMIGVTIKFLIIQWVVRAIITLCIFLLPFYLLISLPRRIEIDNHFINIIWPWGRLHLSKSRIKKIKVKKHRLKSVFIILSLKDGFFCNFIPIRFDWNFQKEDYNNVLKILVQDPQDREKN